MGLDIKYNKIYLQNLNIISFHSFIKNKLKMKFYYSEIFKQIDSSFTIKLKLKL